MSPRNRIDSLIRIRCCVRLATRTLVNGIFNFRLQLNININFVRLNHFSRRSRFGGNGVRQNEQFANKYLIIRWLKITRKRQKKKWRTLFNVNSRSANVRWNAVQAKRFGLGRIANRSFPIGLLDSHTFNGAHATPSLWCCFHSNSVKLRCHPLFGWGPVRLHFCYLPSTMLCNGLLLCKCHALPCFALLCLALDLSQHTESTELNNKVQTTIKDVDDDDGKHVNNA